MRRRDGQPVDVLVFGNPSPLGGESHRVGANENARGRRCRCNAVGDNTRGGLVTVADARPLDYLPVGLRNPGSPVRLA